MKTATLLIANALFVTTAFGASNDPLAEERYKAKYSRNSPPEEMRRSSLNAGPEKDATQYIGQACCRQMDPGTSVPAGVGEERHRAKYGRNTEAAETAKRAAQAELNAHVEKCSRLGHCPLVAVKKTATKPASDAAARLQAKLGITVTPALSNRPASERTVLTAHAHPRCEEPCCNRAE